MAKGTTTKLTPELWEAARDDYIFAGLTQRQIADKYNISSGTIGARAAREGWTNMKKQASEAKRTAAADTLLLTHSEGDPEVVVQRVAMTLLNKLSERFSALMIDDMTPTAIKSYTSALKDLNDILGKGNDEVRMIEVVFNNAGEDDFNG